MSEAKQLLIVAHAPSENTRRLRDALAEGARDPEIDGVQTTVQSPFDTVAAHVLRAHGVILLTTENLAYMSGAMKDFFDRTYYGLLEEKQGMPYRLVVRAGSDGTGTCRAVAGIATGLRWKAIEEPLVCRGTWQNGFVEQAREAGMLMAAGLEAGVF